MPAAAARRPQNFRATLARLAFALAAPVLFAGCQGTQIAEHERGNLESPGEAPSDGEYNLYSRLPPTLLKGPVPLKRGDRLGFRTAETGRIIVVAGEEEWTYEDASMEWRRKE
ncbi:MAG: hypothetical protein JWO31_3694 [Phycisphaerales bacterium]|nr:hypothetical protein [Phycisphaerales bacterium]